MDLVGNSGGVALGDENWERFFMCIPESRAGVLECLECVEHWLVDVFRDN